MDKLKLAEQALVNDNIPDFNPGDTVTVHYRVREGDKERIQKFEGVVISRRGSGPNESFICRKVSTGNIGVERIFPLHSPFIAKIELQREGDVRRSKLYYLRDRQGKAARVKEKDRRNLQGAAAETKMEEEQTPEPKTTDQDEHEVFEEDQKPQKTTDNGPSDNAGQQEAKPKAVSEEE